MDALYLVRSGVPFDVAFSLPADERAEWVVALGSLAGRSFDWETRSWDQP